MAAELLKRGLQTSVTFGNAKSIDLLAHNPRTGENFTVQVKTLRKKNYFPIKPSAIGAEHVYVFVLLNLPGQPVNYFIVPGRLLLQEQERFGKDFQHPTFPGIHPRSLEEFSEAWNIFDKPPTKDELLAKSSLVKMFEGGSVHTAEHGGNFFVIVSEAAMEDFLEPEDRGQAEGSGVYTFPTAASRNQYLVKRRWTCGSGL